MVQGPLAQDARIICEMDVSGGMTTYLYQDMDQVEIAYTGSEQNVELAKWLAKSAATFHKIPFDDLPYQAGD